MDFCAPLKKRERQSQWYRCKVRKVERVDLDELMKRYPEAFRRRYHPAAGLRMERILVKGE